MKNLTKLVENELQPFGSGEVLHAPVEKMTVGERMFSHPVVKWMISVLTEREKELNAKLKEDVKTVGVENDKGHRRFVHEGFVATVEKRAGKAPDEDGVKALLVKNGIDPNSVFDEVKVQQFNPSKLDALVQVGKIKQADVDALKKTTYALFTELSPEAQKMLDEMASHFNAEKALAAGSKPPDGKKTKGASAS